MIQELIEKAKIKADRMNTDRMVQEYWFTKSELKEVCRDFYIQGQIYEAQPQGKTFDDHWNKLNTEL